MAGGRHRPTSTLDCTKMGQGELGSPGLGADASRIPMDAHRRAQRQCLLIAAFTQLVLGT